MQAGTCMVASQAIRLVYSTWFVLCAGIIGNIEARRRCAMVVVPINRPPR